MCRGPSKCFLFVVKSLVIRNWYSLTFRINDTLLGYVFKLFHRFRTIRNFKVNCKSDLKLLIDVSTIRFQFQQLSHESSQRVSQSKRMPAELKRSPYLNRFIYVTLCMLHISPVLPSRLCVSRPTPLPTTTEESSLGQTGPLRSTALFLAASTGLNVAGQHTTCKPSHPAHWRSERGGSR